MSRQPGGAHRVALLGLGLMGTSLGLALRRGAPDWERVGHDPGPAAAAALAAGAVHHLAPSPGQAVAGADLVVLAAPVDSILGLLPEIADSLAAGCLVTDLGSTKERIVEAAAGFLTAANPFVGGHPLAGAESSGPGAGRDDLFQGCAWVLCPGAAPAAAIARVRHLAELAGAAQVVEMDPIAHDRAVALVSHLPQLVAVELLACVAAHPEGPQALALAAGGFADLTRVGSSPFAVWEGILETNHTQVLAALDRFRGGLDRLRERLAARDWAALSLAFRLARDTRDTLAGPRDARQQGDSA